MSKPVARTVGVLFIAALLVGSLGCSRFERTGEATAQAAGIGTGTVAAPDNREMGPAVTPPSGEMADQGRVFPGLGTAERLVLAYPRRRAGGKALLDANRAVTADVAEWPAMKYLGEDAGIRGVGYAPVSVRPMEVRIVQGSSIPLSYSPELDTTRPEPEGSPRSFRGLLDKPVMLIPPNASLVMVRIETTPSPGHWAGRGVYQCPDDGIQWGYSPSEFRLGYPGLGETRVNLTDDSYWFGEFQAPSKACPGNGWLYFILPGLNVDPSLVWLEYVSGTGTGQLAFWTLSERP